MIPRSGADNPLIAEIILDYREKHKTNADRIRAMSDEELAKFIGSIVTVDYDPFVRIQGKIVMDELDWLQQEVDDGGDD